MPNLVKFVAHSQQKVESLKEEEKTYNRISQAIEVSNKSLDADGVKASVVFMRELSGSYQKGSKNLDPKNNMLLGIRVGDEEEPIDMIDVKALDEISVKSVDELAEEIVSKVKQHLAAKKIKEIIFSESGSKLDTRLLKNHKVSKDDAEFLTVDNHRIAVQAGDKEYWVLKAPHFRSYTITRLVDEGDKIRLFDDYDLCRKDKKGMLIDVSKVYNIAVEQLVERSRLEAKNYNGTYFLIQRDEITEDIANRLHRVLLEIPSP